VTLLGTRVPPFHGDYGHDLAPNALHPEWPVRFSEMVAYRPIIEARRHGHGAVALWLCEGGEGLVWRDEKVVGVHDDLLRGLEVIQEAARLHGLRVYWQLLDSGSEDPITKAALADPHAPETILPPIVERLDREHTLALGLGRAPHEWIAAAAGILEKRGVRASAATPHASVAIVDVGGEPTKHDAFSVIAHAEEPRDWDVDVLFVSP